MSLLLICPTPSSLFTSDGKLYIHVYPGTCTETKTNNGQLIRINFHIFYACKVDCNISN